MLKRSHIITAFLIILIISSAMCFGGPKEKEVFVEEWWDLEDFNEYLENNYNITIKDEKGSEKIQKISKLDGSLYIAVGIDEAFTDIEIEALHHYVESGGNIIIAGDDDVIMNPLANKFGITYSQYSIIDLDYDLNIAFIPATVELGNSSYLIIAHDPLGLEFEDKLNDEIYYQVLAQSSDRPNEVSSALNIKDDLEITGEDKPGPIPFMVEVTVDKGKAVFISDSGMFTNRQWECESHINSTYYGRVYENNKFIPALIDRMYEPNNAFIYDTSKQKEGFSNFHGYPYPHEDVSSK